MWKDVRANLASVKQPLLFFRSDDDHVVDVTSKGIILDGVSSTVKEFVELKDSFHVATLDNDAQLIFDRTAEFITANVGATP
jgi:carboxylesterase